MAQTVLTADASAIRAAWNTLSLANSDPDSFYGATVTAASGDQTITGALFTDSDTFPAATVGTSYSITGALLSDADTFFASTTSATYPLTGGIFTDGDTFQSATLTTAYTVNGGLFSDADTFHAASVLLQQDQAITGTLFANDNVFHAARIADASAKPEVWWPIRRKRLDEDDEPKLSVPETKKLVQKARRKVLKLIEVGEVRSLADALGVVEEIAPDNQDTVFKRIEAEARRALLKKQEEEDDEEDAILLLIV